MAAKSPLVQQLESVFSSAVRARGAGYASQNRVELLELSDQGTTAIVRGSRGHEYDVQVDWDRKTGVVTVDCNCPYHEDTGPCKHLWAVILKLGEAVDPAQVPQRITELNQLAGEGGYTFDDDEPVDDDELMDDESVDFQEILKRAARGLGINFRNGNPFGTGSRRKKSSSKKKKKPSRPKPPPVPEWVQDLSPIRQPPRDGNLLDAVAAVVDEELRLVLDVGVSQARQGLWFNIQCRQRGTTGNFGKWKQKTLQSWRRGSHDSPHETLLWNLIGHAEDLRDHHGGGYYYRSTSYTDLLLTEPGALRLLQTCCDAGLVFWRLSTQAGPDDVQPVAWDAGPPWALQLDVTADEAQQAWGVSGRLVRAETGETVRPHEVVLALGGLAVLHQNRLGPCAHPEHAAWTQVLRRKPEVRVPFADREQFLQTIYQHAAPPIARWPENLATLRITVPPVPRLKLRPWQRSRNGQRCILGEVLFEYDGHAFSPHTTQAALRLTDPDRIIERDSAAERERLVQLFEQPGLKRFYEDQRYAYGYGHGHRLPPGQHDVELPETQLPRLLEALAATGWLIESEGQLVRGAGAFQLDVTSGVDWFDLSGACDFGGVSAGLPELLRAVRSGDGYITLSDGTRGLLTQELSDRLQRLSDFGREEGSGVRFSGAQALLLDALLAAKEQQVQVDDRFRQMRSKLQQVHGIEPQSQPESFEGTLRDYQREGLGWLKFLEEFGFGGCLADDMGLGKTIQVLALLESRRTQPLPEGMERRPSIVVVPKSLIFNWVNEAARFAPHLRTAAYHGLGRKEWLDRLDELDLLVTTYGTLRQDIADLQAIPFDYAILDEAQAIKNPTAQAAKAVRLLEARHRLAMTGTPVENHLGDLWSLFEFLNPGLLGRSQNFQRLTKQLGEQPAAVNTLSRGIRPYVLRRTKEQVLTELPEKTEQTIFCELSAKERKLYNELRDHYRKSLLGQVETQGLAKSKIHILEALLRLRQAACHAGLVNKAHLKESSTKLDTLEEQLEELLSEGHKAIVFSQFTSLLSILKARLDRRKVVYEYLDGKTTKREQCVQRFQTDNQCRLFLISLKAGGQGLNLTAADYVFILDPWWNPAVEAQAIDRAHRLGQQRHVFAYRLIASDTVEEKILSLQAHKRELAESIISEDTSILRSLSMDDLQLLLS